MFIQLLRKLRISYFVIFLLVISGCSLFENIQNESSMEFPITLYISNQDGHYINPVHITVEIDALNKIVDQDFLNITGGHSYSQYELNLKKGQHHIIVTSSNGNAGLDVIFTVDKPLWLSLSYWGENHFQLLISEQPFLFG